MTSSAAEKLGMGLVVGTWGVDGWYFARTLTHLQGNLASSIFSSRRLLLAEPLFQVVQEHVRGRGGVRGAGRQPPLGRGVAEQRVQGRGGAGERA